MCRSPGQVSIQVLQILMRIMLVILTDRHHGHVWMWLRIFGSSSALGALSPVAAAEKSRDACMRSAPILSIRSWISPSCKSPPNLQEVLGQHPGCLKWVVRVSRVCLDEVSPESLGLACTRSKICRQEALGFVEFRWFEVRLQTALEDGPHRVK